MARNKIAPGRDKFPDDKQLFTSKEAAEYIGRSVGAIRSHTRAGNLRPSATYGGINGDRGYLFSRETLEELYEKHCYKGVSDD